MLFDVPRAPQSTWTGPGVFLGGGPVDFRPEIDEIEAPAELFTLGIRYSIDT